MRCTSVLLFVFLGAGCAHDPATSMPSHSRRTAASDEAIESGALTEAKPSSELTQANLGQPQPAEIRKEPANAELVATQQAALKGPDAAPESSQPPSRAETALRERVQEALLNSNTLSYSAKHVRVDVAQEDVTLRGDVRTAHERSDVEQVVEKLRGVKRVHNELAVVNKNPTETARQNADDAARLAR